MLCRGTALGRAINRQGNGKYSCAKLQYTLLPAALPSPCKNHKHARTTSPRANRGPRRRAVRSPSNECPRPGWRRSVRLSLPRYFAAPPKGRELAACSSANIRTPRARLDQGRRLKNRPETSCVPNLHERVLLNQDHVRDLSNRDRSVITILAGKPCCIDGCSLQCCSNGDSPESTSSRSSS